MSMTEEEVRRRLAGQITPEQVRERYAAMREKRGAIPSMMSGIGRGVQDFFEGIQQLMLSDELGPNDVTTPRREFTQMVNEDRAQVSGDEVDPLGRLIGQSAMLAPLMAIPGGSGPLLTRLAAGAATGGVSGALQYAPSGTTRERVFNTGMGAVGGAVVPEVVRGGLTAGTGVVRSAAGRTGPTPEALARAADYDALGIRATTGQVTRNPRALANERNLGQMAGVGDEIMAIRAGQQPALVEALDNAVGGPRMTPTQAGDEIVGALGTRFSDGGVYQRLGREIDGLYTAARAADGADNVLPFSDFMRSAEEALVNFEDVIPGPVQTRLREFAEDRAFTVAEAVKLRQLLNARSRSTNNPAEGSALTALKRSLDEVMGAAAESGTGGEALSLFQQASAASAQRARMFDGLEQVVAERVAPDDFVRRFVIGGKRDDLLRMRNTLRREGGAEGARAWEVMRRQVLEHLQDNAVNEAGAFGQAGYNRALEKIGVDRLRVFFNNDEIAQLQRIGRAATNLLSDPPSGGIPIGNRSGTAAGNLSNAPFMDWVNRITRSREAAQAVRGSPVDRIANAQTNRNIADRLTNPRGINPFAVPGGIMGVLTARALAGGGGR